MKTPGERFAKGDVIAVVETQKGAIEVEVFHDGFMGRPLVEIGQTVPVGTPMAELEVPGVEPEAAAEQAGEALARPTETTKPAIQARPSVTTAVQSAKHQGFSLCGGICLRPDEAVLRGAAASA